MTLTLHSQSPDAIDRPRVEVLTDRCAGCQECVIRCPVGALSMDTGRWVALADEQACVGCRQCVRTCPFSAIVVEGPLLVQARQEPQPQEPGAVAPEALVGDVGEVRQGFADWDEALAEAQRCLQCPDPTCVRGCPAHNDIPGFIKAVRERDLVGAHRALRATSVLPDICSRVCNQAAQCEGACSWSLAGGVPVAVGHLERFVTEMAPVPPPAVAPQTGELSVAVVGSGPAAMGAAWELVEAGASVTVYEKDATPGGLCNWGIPDFTLPAHVAERPWRQLTAAGVDLRCGTEISPGDLEELATDHDAVVLAHGAGNPLRLPVPGAELDGVTDATTFLQGAKLALEPGGDPASFRESLGLAHPASADRAPRVLVLGAGNTAMDVARTARRLRLAATCVDWLDEHFALTRPDELAEARGEGVEVLFGRTLRRIVGSQGRVSRAELARTAQQHQDRAPKVLDGDPEILQVDLVVMAMGYRLDPLFADLLPGTPVSRQVSGLPDRHWVASGILSAPASGFAERHAVGTLALGRQAGLDAAAWPIHPRLWVAGDALVGPSTVVEAMAQGRRAAQAVLRTAPGRPGRATRVLVCYESQGGTTARAAHGVARAFTGRGDQVRVAPITEVTWDELVAADTVVVGTWVEGLVVAGVRPAGAMRRWLERLPSLGGKPVGIFCTYAVAPRRSLEAMRQALERAGAEVIGQAAFGRRALGAGAADGPARFGHELIGSLPSSLHPAANESGAG